MKPKFELTEWYVIGTLLTKAVDAARRDPANSNLFSDIRIDLAGNNAEKIFKSVESGGGDVQAFKKLSIHLPGIDVPNIVFKLKGEYSDAVHKQAVMNASKSIFEMMCVLDLQDKTLEKCFETRDAKTVCMYFKIK